MEIAKYNCETMYDAPEPYGIMVQEPDGSYVSSTDYDELKEAALALFIATSTGVRNSSAEVQAKETLINLLGL